MALYTRENLDWVEFMNELPPENVPLIVWGRDIGVQKAIRQGGTLQPEVSGLYSHWALWPEGPPNGVSIG